MYPTGVIDDVTVKRLPKGVSNYLFSYYRTGARRLNKNRGGGGAKGAVTWETTLNDFWVTRRKPFVFCVMRGKGRSRLEGFSRLKCVPA
jgi:hypothetical protein